MFRLLSDGETYEPGDQYYDRVMDDWRLVSLIVVGAEHVERSSGGRCFARRKISDTSEADKPTANKARQVTEASTQICPKCNGVGWYACQVGVDTAEQCQCEDCGGTGKLLPC